jgi:hypothetical protein
MLRETTAIVANLGAWLESRFGAAVRVVETDDYRAQPSSDAILVLSTHFGDLYAGGHYSDTLSFARDGLAIRFCIAEHDLSGQCDTWSADIRGAAADERTPLAGLFHPRQRRGHWSDHAHVTFIWDGVAGSF